MELNVTKLRMSFKLETYSKLFKGNGNFQFSKFIPKQKEGKRSFQFEW